MRESLFSETERELLTSLVLVVNSPHQDASERARAFRKIQAEAPMLIPDRFIPQWENHDRTPRKLDEGDLYPLPPVPWVLTPALYERFVELDAILAEKEQEQLSVDRRSKGEL